MRKLIARWSAGLMVATVPAVPHTPVYPAAASQHGYTYVHHPVSTDVPAAQQAFDRGLTMVFAYQEAEGEQAFREALRLDPTLAMGWWGIALALGPDINEAPEPGKTARAAAALARASSLAAKRATTEELEYIGALRQRYSATPNPDFDRLAAAYRDAMRELVHRHPGDPDTCALFAEASMDLRPWRLWDADGHPEDGTPELVSVLEDALRAHPDHLGLLHFYIHAVEASRNPERALVAARRLAALPMEPAAAHLVHMPAHIFMRVGDFEAAVQANDHATQHALEFRRVSHPHAGQACGHCADFLTYAYMMLGDAVHARAAAETYASLSGDPTNSIAVRARFHQWADLLAFPDPATKHGGDERDIHATRAFWLFGRGLAYVGTQHIAEAQRTLGELQAEASRIPAPRSLTGAADVEHVLDKISENINVDGAKIAMALLGARIDEARGDLAGAIDLMRAAVQTQDEIPYREPPAWYYPVRESLGSLLLRANRLPEAETTFRQDLARSPNNPRSILGLSTVLQAMGRTAEAASERSRFQSAWQYSDVTVTAEDL